MLKGTAAGDGTFVVGGPVAAAIAVWAPLGEDWRLAGWRTMMRGDWWHGDWWRGD